MTICVVALLGHRTREEWYAWVKERVDNKVGWDTPEEISPVFSSQGGTGQGAEPAYGSALGGLVSGGGAGGGGQGQGQGMRLGGFGGLGGSGVLSALAGGLQQGVGGTHDEQPQGIRLPGALAGALSGAGIVFRPGSQLSQDGEQLYEAHIVENDDSGSEGETPANTTAAAASGQSARTAEEARPGLEHQPEIVESPKHVGAESTTTTVRPSSEEGAEEGKASRLGDPKADVDVSVSKS